MIQGNVENESLFLPRRFDVFLKIILLYGNVLLTLESRNNAFLSQYDDDHERNSVTSPNDWKFE